MSAGRSVPAKGKRRRKSSAASSSVQKLTPSCPETYRLVERGLAEGFGVSRVPVREAIRIPLGEGFLYGAIAAGDAKRAGACPLRHVRHYRDVALRLLFG